MGHKTLIGGTGYEIVGGKVLAGGTAYGVEKGRTTVGGTGYDIAFKSPPQWVLLGSGVGSSSQQYYTYSLPANTVCLVGEARRWSSSYEVKNAVGGLMPYRNGTWIEPTGQPYGNPSQVTFQVSGSTVNVSVPGMNLPAGYEIYAVTSTKAAWHTLSGSVLKNSGWQVFNPVPEGFICIVGEYYTRPPDTQYQYSCYYLSPGIRALSGNSTAYQVTTDAQRATPSGYNFNFSSTAITMPGDKSETYTMTAYALYGV